jgi:indole-3-glycerol phosphate synthase
VSVLDSIIEGVREDLAVRRLPMSQLLEALEVAPPVRDCLATLMTEDISVIAEVKRSSPSKGALAPIVDPAGLAASYAEAGAAVISVLTEQRRFGGTLADLDLVRSSVELPILRKDFMIDEYQFYEARAHGADVILLIVAALSKNQLDDYFHLSKELGMRALIEVHTPGELESALSISPEIVGVNSRNLKTLEVDAQAFAQLIPQIPSTISRVAESGISSRADVEFAHEHGATAILVGEALVRSGNPNVAMGQLLGRLAQ